MVLITVVGDGKEDGKMSIMSIAMSNGWLIRMLVVSVAKIPEII